LAGHTLKERLGTMSQNNRRRRNKKDRKKSGIFSTILLVIAIGVFIFSAYKLLNIYLEYKKGSDEYDKIQKLAITKDKDSDGEDTEGDAFKVDFDALKKINEDTAAWIRFDEPSEINYPVVQGRDNSEYLKRTFEANDNKLGTLFIDAENKNDFSDRNTFIYGHNMKNGTMFAQLKKYQEKSFWEQYPYFYIYTPDGKVGTYQIFSVGVVGDVSDNYQKVFASDEEYLNYLNLAVQSSMYDTGVKLSAESKIVSLSTCTNVKDEERILVQGVRISESVQ